MSKPIILVTGGNGQLGKSIRKIASEFGAYRFVFASREDLGLHHYGLVENYFAALQPQYCINCAAYTAVDKAEAEQEAAMLINGEAVGHLAKVCTQFGTKLIHISTDYVFDGSSATPYLPGDATSPINVYGTSKLKGEELCMQFAPDAIIVRTSWVYSEFGQNFVKTMLRLMQEKPSINVVSDQVGAPTYAIDLARACLEIIRCSSWNPGIYHYCNRGKISWYEFAVAIKESMGYTCEVHPIPTSAYPTPARRPAFSLLDTGSLENTFGIAIPAWEDSLYQCLKALQSV